MPTANNAQSVAPKNLYRPDAHKELHLSPARIVKARALLAKLDDNSSVLDIGCSDGTILEPFVKRLCVFGIDNNTEMVEAAKAKGLRAQVGDIENLPFETSSFDAVFAGEVIEHTLSPDRFLGEVNRVLKGMGKAIFTVPNIRTPIGFAMLLYGIPPMFAARYRSSHLQDFTARLIRTALVNNGFEIRFFTGSAFMIPRIGPRLSYLANIFPSWADHFIIEAVKVRDSPLF